MNNAKERLIVALDVPSLSEALSLAARLEGHVAYVKAGKELFTAEGPRVVDALKARGFGVFLDLKFHDIPQTTRNACRAAAKLGVSMLTIHASGGAEMVYAAVQGAWEGAKAVDAPMPLVLAVTILTSIDEEIHASIGYQGAVAESVERLATLAVRSGASGLVCSPQEAALVRAAVGPEPKIVTPGVRPTGASTDDQKRVMTPRDAIAAGATHLVMGRPIAWAEEPGAAADAAIAEIAAALG